MNTKLLEHQAELVCRKLRLKNNVDRLQKTLEFTLNQYAAADIALKEFERKRGGEE